jgi:hypothetical protein
VIDFGTLGMSEKRDHYFTILNKNPVTIQLDGWGSNLTDALIELMGVEAGNETEILQVSIYLFLYIDFIFIDVHFYECPFPPKTFRTRPKISNLLKRS